MRELLSRRKAGRSVRVTGDTLTAAHHTPILLTQPDSIPC
jgi:hypothetical protein